MNEKQNQYSDTNSFYIKVMSFCICIIVDIIVNSITQFLNFGNELANYDVYNNYDQYQDEYINVPEPDHAECRIDDKYMCWVFVFLQCSFIIIMIFITLSIISKTFYFQQGLLGLIIKKFKFAFLMDFLYIGLIISERLIMGYRLNKNEKEYNITSIEIWNKWYYIIAYVLKYIAAFLFYITNLDMCLELGKPNYYKKDFSVIPGI
jgi:hypothetical protein